MNNYIKLLESPKPSVIVVTGPSGTGKTMQACRAGQKSPMYDRIVLTRPAITLSGESHGYIPGTLDEKMDPWIRPSLEYLGPHQKKRVETCPLSFMRGRTFDKTWIIADEMQNSTKEQMLMLLTRIGYGSKLVIIGDPDQSDLDFGTYSGIDDLLNRFVTSDELAHVRLKDVYRSPVVKEVLSMYSNRH